MSPSDDTSSETLRRDDSLSIASIGNRASRIICGFIGCRIFSYECRLVMKVFDTDNEKEESLELTRT